MAKKKSKKKNEKKKNGKKKLLKLKLIKKKDSKKKDSKKKDSKKKDSKKKDSKKKEKKKKEKKKKKPRKKPPLAGVQPEVQSISTPKVPLKKPIAVKTDHSSNYNVREAVKKLRKLKNKEELRSFTEGEKRLTVTKTIPAAMKRLK